MPNKICERCKGVAPFSNCGAYVCDDCRKEKLKGYRPEIFTDGDYECDEPIEPEPEVGPSCLGNW